MSKRKWLTAQERQAIRQTKADNPHMTLKQVASHLGVSISCVSQTLSGEYASRRSVVAVPAAKSKAAPRAMPGITLAQLTAGR